MDTTDWTLIELQWAAINEGDPELLEKFRRRVSQWSFLEDCLDEDD